MRRVLLVILTGIITLSAVEWDIEEIPPEPNTFNLAPLIALDNQGYARVLFVQVDFGVEELIIKVASNKTGSWVAKDVATLLEFGNYSIDVDQDGNTYVAYADMPGPEEFHYDIFLAFDKTGDFEVENLTEGNTNLQYIPAIQVDNNGVVKLLYYDDNELDSLNLIYGWKNGGELNTKLVTSDVSYDDYHSIDLVLEQDGSPHAFYFDGENDYIWHATPQNGPAGDWLLEQVNDRVSYEVTAAIDQSGYFHLAYDHDYDPLFYITNKSGSWVEEIVADGSTGGNEEPSIAIDPQGNPHIAWLRTNIDYWYDICYGTKTAEGWTEELVTNTPADDEMPGVGHFFAIDNAGYGHLVYTYFCESEEQAYMYYAKTTEPLSTGSVSEQPVAPVPSNLSVRGSGVYFSVSQSGYVSISVFDAAGRQVDQLVSGNYPAGEHVIDINTEDYPAGVYFIRGEISRKQVGARLFVY